MAFIGILPRQESFGEKMGRSIGQALGGGAVALAQGLAARQQQKKRAEYFGNLAKQHPDDPMYQALSDIAASPASETQQNAFVRAILGHKQNPFLQQQQERLDRDSMAKLYNQKIREIDDELKYGMYDVDKDSLRAQKKQLQQQRDMLFEGLKSKKYDVSDFAGLGDMEEAEESEVSAQDEEDEDFYPRVMFNFKNPKHIAARDKALKMAKGDRAKAEQILRKRFKL